MTDGDSPSISDSALREHAEFVRRVARAVVRDEGLAEDVTQETLLAAWTNPPQDPNALRGWLRRVARNFALRILRREQRFAEREAVAARPDVVESTAETVERAALLRGMVDAVLTLDEPYRRTILLRYFDELQPSEIAERDGISASTVRTRIQRGLAALRGRLDDEHGDRNRWRSALLLTFARGGPEAPVAVPEPCTVASQPTAPLGSLVMSVSSKVVVTTGVAALAAIAALVFLWEPGETDGRAPAAGGGPRAAETRGDDARLADDPASPSREPPAASTAARALVSGKGAITGEVRVLLSDEAAVGVAVRLAVGTDDEGRTVHTTDRGAFRFDGVEPGHTLSLTVEHEGGPDPRLADLQVFPEQELHAGTLWLSPPLELAVHVVDETGAGVAGADVAAFATRSRATARDLGGAAASPVVRATTDSDGEAPLAELTAGTWTFRASCDGFAPGGVADVRVSGNRADEFVRIVLERGAPLGGQVTDADGKPLAGVRVVAAPPRDGSAAFEPPPVDALRTEAVTDAEGMYAFPALARGTHSIGVAADGGSLARLWIVSVPGVERYDIQLSGSGIYGMVRDAETGQGLADAVVRAAAWRAHHPTYWVATTGPDGRYELPIPLASMIQGPARAGGGVRGVHFTVERRGYAMVPEGVETKAEGAWVAGERAEWNVRMRRAASLSGVVAGPDGPVAGAEVTAEVWHAYFGSVRASAVSGADGTYIIDGLQDGRAKVTALKEGYFQVPGSTGGWLQETDPPREITVQVPLTGAASLDLVLARGRTVSGTVTDADGRPVAGARVSALAPGAPGTTTDDSGRFTLRGVPLGDDVTIVVEKTGLARAELAVGEDGRIDAAMEPVAVVSGVVRGASGGVPPGAYVQVADAQVLATGTYMLVGIWERSEKHPVSAAGRFEIPVDMTGDATTVRVRAAAPGMAPTLSPDVAVARGNDASGVTLSLGPGHAIDGRVVAADGSGPVPGATIEIVNAQLPPEIAQTRADMFNPGGRPFEIVAVSGPDGRFRITGLPEWNYQLRVLSDTHMRGGSTVGVPADEPVVIELGTGFPISGFVRYDDGEPVVGINVHALAGQGAAGSSRTASDGSFRIPGLREGDYPLRVQAAGFVESDVLPETLQTVAAGTDGVELVAQRSAGRISGRCVMADGTPVAGANVSAKPMDGGSVVRTRTDGTGAFTLSGLGESAYALYAMSRRGSGGPEHFADRSAGELVDVAVGASDLVLDMGPTITWTGVVVREDGEALPNGAPIHVRVAPESPWRIFGRLETDGSFSFAAIRRVPHEVTVSDPVTGRTFELADGPVFTPSETPSRFVIPSGVGISGVVRGAAGRPVTGVAVIAVDPQGAKVHAVSDVAGRFHMTGLQPGVTYELIGFHHDEGRAEHPGVRGGDTDVAVSLRPSEALELRLVDEHGEPDRDRSFQLRREDGVLARMRTDTEGRARSVAFRPGRYDVLLDGADVPVGAVGTGEGEITLTVR